MCKLDEFLQSEHTCADSTWMEKVSMTYTSEAPYPRVTPSCHCVPAPPRAVMRLTPNSTDSFCLVFSHFIQMQSSSVAFVSGFFHSTLCLWDSGGWKLLNSKFNSCLSLLRVRVWYRENKNISFRRANSQGPSECSPHSLASTIFYLFCVFFFLKILLWL